MRLMFMSTVRLEAPARSPPRARSALGDSRAPPRTAPRLQVGGTPAGASLPNRPLPGLRSSSHPARGLQTVGSAGGRRPGGYAVESAPWPAAPRGEALLQVVVGASFQASDLILSRFVAYHEDHGRPVFGPDLLVDRGALDSRQR